MSDLEVLLAVPLWLTWLICPGEDGVRRAISTVSMHRLRELAPRLLSTREPAADGDLHQLVRFNLLNLGEQAVSVCAIALTSLRGERLVCEVFPSVVVAPGARHPFLVELTKGPVSETVVVEVDVSGARVSVHTQTLPRSS